MENFSKIREDIYTYLDKIHPEFDPREKMEIIITKISSITNNNYHIQIFEKLNIKRHLDLFYRKFNQTSNSVDRKLESSIIQKLSESDLTPKILFEDPKGKYRIEEYLHNTTSLKKDKQFKSDIIAQVIQICISYSMISSIYSYRITDPLGYGLGFDGEIEINHDFDFRKTNISNNIMHNFYDMTIGGMLKKAQESFAVFAEKMEAYLSQFPDEILEDDYFKVAHNINNFQWIFQQRFPKNGYLILNHNDIHCKNLLYDPRKAKYIILDHEYAGLNLIGFDFVHYLNESVFNYSPDYCFNKEDIDFDLFYEHYLTFIERFEKERPELNETYNGKEILNEVKEKRYYFNLHYAINLFWILYCAINMTFEDYIERKGFNYFQHAVDRVEYIRTTCDKLVELGDDGEESEEWENDPIVCFKGYIPEIDPTSIIA